jgi:hypothetical protein
VHAAGHAIADVHQVGILLQAVDDACLDDWGDTRESGAGGNQGGGNAGHAGRIFILHGGPLAVQCAGADVDRSANHGIGQGFLAQFVVACVVADTGAPAVGFVHGHAAVETACRIAGACDFTCAVHQGCRQAFQLDAVLDGVAQANVKSGREAGDLARGQAGLGLRCVKRSTHDVARRVLAAQRESAERRDQACESLAVKQVAGGVHADAGAEARRGARGAGRVAISSDVQRGLQCALGGSGKQSERHAAHGRQHQVALHEAVRHLATGRRAVGDGAGVEFEAVFKGEDGLVAAADVFGAAKTEPGAFDDAAGDVVDGAVAQAGDMVVAAIKNAVDGHGALRHGGRGGQKSRDCSCNEGQFFHGVSRSFN